MWLSVVPASQTKAEIRELLKMCENNIFQAGLSNDIAWALVKLTNSGESGTVELLETYGSGDAQVH